MGNRVDIMHATDGADTEKFSYGVIGRGVRQYRLGKTLMPAYSHRVMLMASGQGTAGAAKRL